MTEPSQTSLSKILPWIILLLAALGLFYFVEKGFHPSDQPAGDKKEMRSDSLDRDSL